jgi:hypothetical protein
MRTLQLLALIEHPSALPTGSALRIGRELLEWIAQGEAKFRCDPMVATETRMEAAA